MDLDWTVRSVGGIVTSRGPGIACRPMSGFFRSMKSTGVFCVFALAFTSTHNDTLVDRDLKEICVRENLASLQFISLETWCWFLLFLTLKRNAGPGCR